VGGCVQSGTNETDKKNETDICNGTNVKEVFVVLLVTSKKKLVAFSQPNGVKFEFPFFGLIGSVYKTSLITLWVWTIF
jgi:hypothetical protein